VSLRKSPIQRKGQSNLPENIKSGVENLSGIAMNDVNVHFNSGKPAQLAWDENAFENLG